MESHSSTTTSSTNNLNNVNELYKTVIESINTFNNNWSKNQRKRYGKMAFSLGLVNSIVSFYKMFPITSRKNNGKKDNSYWREKWIRWANPSKRLLEVVCYVDFTKYYNEEKNIYDFIGATKKVLSIFRTRHQKNEQPKSTIVLSGRSHGIYSQRTQKEWGSAFRPAKISR